jgi:hypothetical protein
MERRADPPPPPVGDHPHSQDAAMPARQRGIAADVAPADEACRRKTTQSERHERLEHLRRDPRERFAG